MGKRWYKKKYEQELILSRHCAPGPFPFVLVLDHLKSGFNIPKMIRAANAFGCREIHLVSIPLFDPSPAKGTLRQTLTRSFETFDESYAALTGEGYELFALDVSGKKTLGSFAFPKKAAFIVGHEEFGLSFDVEKYPAVTALRIPQFGKVQSLNVSIAASLAMFEYLRGADFQPPVPS